MLTVWNETSRRWQDVPQCVTLGNVTYEWTLCRPALLVPQRLQSAEHPKALDRMNEVVQREADLITLVTNFDSLLDPEQMECVTQHARRLRDLKATTTIELELEVPKPIEFVPDVPQTLFGNIYRWTPTPGSGQTQDEDTKGEPEACGASPTTVAKAFTPQSRICFVAGRDLTICSLPGLEKTIVIRLPEGQMKRVGAPDESSLWFVQHSPKKTIVWRFNTWTRSWEGFQADSNVPTRVLALRNGPTVRALTNGNETLVKFKTLEAAEPTLNFAIASTSWNWCRSAREHCMFFHLATSELYELDAESWASKLVAKDLPLLDEARLFALDENHVLVVLAPPEEAVKSPKRIFTDDEDIDEGEAENTQQPTTNSTICVDVRTGHWETWGRLAVKREKPAIFRIGTRVVVVGGTSLKAPSPNSMEILDLDSRTWSLSPMKLPNGTIVQNFAF